jgi:phosphoglycolate phosphatase
MRAPKAPMTDSARRVLLFDLDGTLTDPQPGIVRCMRYALDKLGAACPSGDVLASFIGPSLRGTFATLLETSDRELVDQAMTFYREQYGVTGLFENQVYDGIVPLLDHVRLTATPSFVATLKPKTYAERIVRHLGLAPYFAGVYGPGLDEPTDDKIDLLADLLATERVASGQAVMIGDRAGDMVAARANRVRSIGALWGYGSEAELAAAGADSLCASPSELAACLARLRS